MAGAKLVVKRPALPLILLANDVLDGDVVFHSGDRWSLRVEDALVAADEEGALRLEALRDAAEVSEDVIEPYLVTVAADASGRMLPVHHRERLRALGPSIRLDLGKQAGKTAGAA